MILDLPEDRAHELLSTLIHKYSDCLETVKFLIAARRILSDRIDELEELNRELLKANEALLHQGKNDQCALRLLSEELEARRIETLSKPETEL